MVTNQRRATPGVRDGRVQKKQGWAINAGDYYTVEQREVRISRERPGVGFRHLLTVDDVRRFVALLPHWDVLSDSLNAIVLASASRNYDGWQTRGVVAVCAWERELWRETTPEYYTAHREIMERFGVVSEPLPGGDYLCQWTEASARHFQLLHILLHELGHHHDLITTRSRRRSARGEGYAESYALRYEAQIWDDYFRVFRF